MDKDIDNTRDDNSDTMGQNDDTKRGSTTTRSQTELGEIDNDDDTDIDEDDTGGTTSRSETGAGE